MDRGLYIAAAGMLAEQLRQDQIANDLANASTPGYKSDRTAQQSFDEVLLTNSVTGATVGTGLGTVQVAEIRTDFSPRSARDTAEPLDFAVVGEGYFAVRTDAGTRYTRNGQFSVSAAGLLVTAQGDPVLGRNGATIAVGADGKVDPRTLDVVMLANPAKAGGSLVSGTVTTTGRAGTVRAGALESSGADAGRSMVDMIASMRAFEAGQRAITTIDATLDKAVNRVGSVSG
jgi:flagellar basal-body rod protein FlgG